MSLNETSAPRFATFWEGEFSAYEAACIHSLIRRGYDVTIYSYQPLQGVPAGAIETDASHIVSASAKTRFLYGGKPDLAHFSDYFRSIMFGKSDAIWVDADILMIREIDEALPDAVLVRERQGVINNAVLRLPNDDRLSMLVRQIESLMDRDLVWGETGPSLLTTHFDVSGQRDHVLSAQRFFAIDHDEIWKAFLPAYRSECEDKTAASWGVHTFNNIVSRLGIWKQMAPPKGSFLHDRFAEDGSLGFFTDVYPAKVMEQLIENWQLRQSGSALGVGAVARQLAPSLGRTLRHYAGPQLSIGTGLSRLRTRFSNA